MDWLQKIQPMDVIYTIILLVFAIRVIRVSDSPDEVCPHCEEQTIFIKGVCALCGENKTLIRK